ncbi:MAG: VOC family protein [Alphaproteobacteria bacterium]|nr:VOC family protein [Alphaproteobacteria bacterium]
MALPSPVIDHVVIDARERMDEAADVFSRLGFTLTPRGHHTLGSMNHLMMFASDYLELLGFNDGGSARPELAPFPVGLNGLVFQTADADVVYAHASEAGLPIRPVQSFSRPVELDGERHDAKFRTTRLDPAQIAMGRVYFCEHQTPELVWRPDWQAHPNGARTIARVIVATDDPAATGVLFDTLFGTGTVVVEGGKASLTCGKARVEMMPPEALRAELGDAVAAASGRREYLAALELTVDSAAETAARLQGFGYSDGERIVVPADKAFNTTLLFRQAG